MVRLNLPEFKEDLPGPPVLSMDRYVRWVLFNWQHIVDQKAVREIRRRDFPKERFILK